MSNIEAAIRAVNAKGHKAFIPFITAGDPNLEATESFIYALEKAGSTVIELGIPFSDPVADGPVIQSANLRAMEQGLHINQVFELVKKVRLKTKVPIVFLLYANIIYHYGTEAFFKSCKASGVDGVIIPDVPLEEKEEFNQFARPLGVDMIALVTPTSKERTKEIAEGASGFLYCVSSLGVTGTREEIATDLEEMFTSIKTYAKVPTALGFGISSAAQAAKLKDFSDGIIVGSAMVKLVEKHGQAADKALTSFTKEMLQVL